MVGGLTKEVKKRLQKQATRVEMARTRRSLGKSCLEGSKSRGGSIPIGISDGDDVFDFLSLARFMLPLHGYTTDSNSLHSHLSAFSFKLATIVREVRLSELEGENGERRAKKLKGGLGVLRRG